MFHRCCVKLLVVPKSAAQSATAAHRFSCCCKPEPASILPLDSTMESSDVTTATTAARTSTRTIVTGSHRVEAHAAPLAHLSYLTTAESSW